MRLSLYLLLALTACASTRPEGSTQPRATWTELGSNGQLIVRAVAKGPCPTLDADGIAIPLHVRETPSPDFPLSVCEAVSPSTAHKLKVGNSEIPRAPVAARRILFLGDTGCRLKPNKTGKVFFQNCNDPAAWPFAGLAAAAAAWKPDLVIHVGDYHYREAPCPPNEPGCVGSETGDTWASWHQDFFAPAAPLLAAAPWIFVRGNHESCNRAGHGWFLLLAAGPDREKCTDTGEPFVVPLSDHRLYVLDSSEKSNIEPSFASVTPSAPGSFTWLLLHRSILTPGGEDFTRKPIKFPTRLAVPGAISAVFTGHRHILSLSEFKDSRPPELITGNGGDTLDALNAKNGERPANFNFHDFGFLTLERERDYGPWLVQEHNRTGAVIGSCTLTEKSGKKTELRCAK